MSATPADATRETQSVEAARPRRGSTPSWPTVAPRRRPIWTDRWAVALALLGLLVDAGLALYLWRQFDTFPELITMHYNAFGEADLIAAKTEIYKLPLIGAVIWASNAALAVVASPLDRVLGRAVLGVALFVQLLICAGAWRILT